MTLDALIERLEKATGPDRFLDLDIAAELFPEEAPHPLPAYTASLDAALALVPEGWGWKGESGLGDGHAFTVGHVGADGFYDRPEGYGTAATPALAVVIAALKARARARDGGE